MHPKIVCFFNLRVRRRNFFVDPNMSKDVSLGCLAGAENFFRCSKGYEKKTLETLDLATNSHIRERGSHWVTWVTLKTDLEVEFLPQSSFPMILIFGTIFPPNFNIPSRRTQNFGILTPSTEIFFQKPQTCNIDLDIWGTNRWAILSMLGSF